MAVRNVYYLDKYNNLKKEPVHFKWRYGDFSKPMMKQRAQDLQEAFKQSHPQSSPIEISSKSSNALGAKASAMQLHIPAYGNHTVEQAFQAGKIYKNAGAMTSAYNTSAVNAKHIADAPLYQHDKLNGFQTPDGQRFPLNPKTAFYDFLYLKGLMSNPQIMKNILKHNAFSDIHATPGKTINTQSKSCALFASLYKKHGLNYIKNLTNNKNRFINMERTLNDKSFQASNNKSPYYATHNKPYHTNRDNYYSRQSYKKYPDPVRKRTPLEKRQDFNSARMILALQDTKRVNNQDITNVLRHHPNIKNNSFQSLEHLRVGWLNDDILNGTFNKQDWKHSLKVADQQLQFAHNRRFPIHAVPITSRNYPQNLLHSRDCPPMMYVQGNPAVLNQKSVAMIGSRGSKRKPLPQSVWSNTRGFADYFVRNGFADVGGLAFGVDSIAHKEAIRQGGHAIAIMPESLDQPVYPRSHTSLARAIIKSGGALVSAKSLGTQPMLWQNRAQFTSSKKALVDRDPYQAKIADGTISMAMGDPKHSGTRHALMISHKEHHPTAAIDYFQYHNGKTPNDPYNYYQGNTFYIHNKTAKSVGSKQSTDQFIHWMDKVHQNKVQLPLTRLDHLNKTRYQNAMHPMTSYQNFKLIGATVNSSFYKHHNHQLLMSVLIKYDDPKHRRTGYLTNVSGARTKNGIHKAKNIYHGQWIGLYGLNKISHAAGRKNFTNGDLINSMNTNTPLIQAPLKFRARAKSSQYFVNANGRSSQVIATDTVQPQLQQDKNPQKNHQSQKQHFNPFQNENNGLEA